MENRRRGCSQIRTAQRLPMNEHDESNEVPSPNPHDTPPPIVGSAANPIPESLRPDPRLECSYWLKRFFACNPFYLVSAALLLFALYQLSTDSMFPNREVAQLTFN